MSMLSTTLLSRAEPIPTPPPESKFWIETPRAALEELWGPTVDPLKTGDTVRPFEKFVGTLLHRERVLLYCTKWEFNFNNTIDHTGGLYQYVFGDVATRIERISRRRVISQYNNITGEKCAEDEGVRMLRDIIKKSLHRIQPPSEDLQFLIIATNRVWEGLTSFVLPKDGKGS
ncbi:hypothetical protein BDZ45DRAFT_686587 [Acephala macrosclerotiorum]|nr:hypothetical protein BDZ45DRAFT_686587 [Acephala macrosclerotiorum]